MPQVVGFARRHGLDMLTAATLVVAVFLLSQPLRDKWARHRADVARAGVVIRNWETVARNSSPLGATPTRMQVVEISDYECPFCRKASAAVDSAVKAGLQISYLNYPLPAHEHAEGAAIAALCAGFSGRFREMHARLMNSTEWQRDSNWTREAKAAGVVNLQEFAACLTGPAVRGRLAYERALADSLGVRGTPTFVSRKATRSGVSSVAELITLDPNQ